MGPQAGDVQSHNRRAYLLQDREIQLPEGKVGMSGAGTAAPAGCTRHRWEQEAELSDRTVWRGHLRECVRRGMAVSKEETGVKGESTGLLDICRYRGTAEGATNPSGSLSAAESGRSGKECHRKVQFHEFQQSGDLQLEPHQQDKTGVR